VSDGVFEEFHGLNTEDPSTEIGETEATHCHNCDLRSGIELLTGFEPSYGRPVSWQGHDFSLLAGEILRDGVPLGVPQPTEPTVTAASGGSLDAGRYEFLVTFLVGMEEGVGSESAAVTADANEKITVDWSASTIPDRVTTAKVYARGGPNYVIEFCEVAHVSRSVTSQTFLTMDIDPTEGIYESFDNAEPPSDVDYLYWQNARLYAVAADKVYYSNVGDLHYGFHPDQVWRVPDNVTGLCGIGEDLAIAWSTGIANIFGQIKTALQKRETSVVVGPTDFLTFISVGGPVLYVNKNKGIYQYDGRAEKKVSHKINPTFPLTGDLRAAWDGRYYCIDHGIGMDFERGDFFTFDSQLQRFIYTTKDFRYDMVRKTGARFAVGYKGSPTVRILRDGRNVETYPLPHSRERTVANRYFPKGRYQRMSLTFSGGAGDKVYAWRLKP
jgi:hypothetical protein